MLINPVNLLGEARASGRALAAFNVHNMEILQGVAAAAAKAGSPLFLQATPATIHYAGADFLVAMAQAAAQRWQVPVVLHLDHAQDIEIIRQCLEAGFTSVMYDGSMLPLADNIHNTRRVAELAATYGAAVEGELGTIGGRAGESQEMCYTDPDEAQEFVQSTGVDMLAVAVGTAHGLYKGEPKLDIVRLAEIAAKVSIPLVLHGGSGVPADAIRQAISLGVAKVNIATELKIPFTQALMNQMSELADQEEGSYDPRKYLLAARGAVENSAHEKISMCWNITKERDDPAMTNLDDAQNLRLLDSLGSLETTEEYHHQFAHGLELANRFELPRDMAGNFHEILVLGTGGGSSIAGALLTSLFFNHLRQPVIINQGYNIPSFADQNTLVLALSHSGNTEEILSALGQACRAGCKIIAITAGGALGEICREESIPCLIVPRDIGHPRRDLGYIVPPLVMSLAKLGLVPDISQDIRESIVLMKEISSENGVEVPLAKNPAKQLATKLQGRIPLIYGSSEHLQAPAWRWKNQFGENSKMMAFYNIVPNLHHDEAVGWDMEPEMLNNFFLIMLRDNRLDNPKIIKRKDITVQMLAERMGGVQEAWAKGESTFARLFSLIHLGDFVSLYAAMMRGIDPTPVEIINLFKEKMGK